MWIARRRSSGSGLRRRSEPAWPRRSPGTSRWWPAPEPPGRPPAKALSSGLADDVRPRLVEVGIDRACLHARAEVVDVGRAGEWRAAKPAGGRGRARRLAGVPHEAGAREDGADPRTWR